MKKAFTLIELIMVIALISIVATMAVSKIGDLRRTSARRISVANQQAVSRAVETFLTTHGQKLNRLDALIKAESSVPRTGSGDGFGNFSVPTEDLLYNGFELTSDEERTAYDDMNVGLTPNLKNILVGYSLSQAEVTALHNFGLKYIMFHAARPLNEFNNLLQDGTYLSTNNIQAVTDPALAAAIPYMVTNQMYVAAVSPILHAGRDVYREFGQELLHTEENEASYDKETCKKEVMATGGPLLAFGLGLNASILGKSQGGLEAIPYAAYPLKKFYRQYILLIRITTDKNNMKWAEFAGVIDPCGHTIRSARLAVDD